MRTNGDMAVLCARVACALQRHEEGHSAHALRVAFIAGSLSAALIAGPGPISTHYKVLEGVFNESLIERERAAARTLLAIVRDESDAEARLSKLEAL